jgi:hypothetical protein
LWTAGQFVQCARLATQAGFHAICSALRLLTTCASFFTSISELRYWLYRRLRVLRAVAGAKEYQHLRRYLAVAG